MSRVRQYQYYLPVLCKAHAASAVHRALGITQLIALYTKLDTQFLPEPVNLRKTIAQVALADSERMQQGEVVVESYGPDVLIKANEELLFRCSIICCSTATKLLLNVPTLQSRLTGKLYPE